MEDDGMSEQAGYHHVERAITWEEIDALVVERDALREQVSVLEEKIISQMELVATATAEREAALDRVNRLADMSLENARLGLRVAELEAQIAGHQCRISWEHVMRPDLVLDDDAGV